MEDNKTTVPNEYKRGFSDGEAYAKSQFVSPKEEAVELIKWCYTSKEANEIQSQLKYRIMPTMEQENEKLKEMFSELYDKFKQG